MNSNTCATTRTWNAHTTYRECGVVTALAVHVVTITRAGASFTAELDGRPVSVLDAAPIGKATACTLHRELGALGYRSHYALAGEALEREVPSLATLTAEEAYTVRSYALGQMGRAA